LVIFFFQAEDGIRDSSVTGVQTCALPISGYEVSDLYDHLCSRLIIGATMPFGRIVPPDNDRDPKRFHMEPVKVFDNLYYVGEKKIGRASCREGGEDRGGGGTVHRRRGAKR